MQPAARPEPHVQPQAAAAPSLEVERITPYLGFLFLLLSTATPGHGIDAPERITWTLGERSEFVPRSQQRRPGEACRARRCGTS